MAFIVSPIQDLGCPTVLLNKGIRTDLTIVAGNPTNPTIAGNSVTFTASQGEFDTTDQSIKFAICGVSNLSFFYTGLIETNNSGYDVLEIKVTGIDVNFLYQRESVEGTPEGYESVTGSPDIDLDNDDPCGYLVEISFNTGDSLYNDGVFYNVSFSVS
tara:strand:+ start:2630 stop:3103 length:474 start_codon:yes stop_codon:yes gene_type:complete